MPSHRWLCRSSMVIARRHGLGAAPALAGSYCTNALHRRSSELQSVGGMRLYLGAANAYGGAGPVTRLVLLEPGRKLALIDG